MTCTAARIQAPGVIVMGPSLRPRRNPRLQTRRRPQLPTRHGRPIRRGPLTRHGRPTRPHPRRSRRSARPAASRRPRVMVTSCCAGAAPKTLSATTSNGCTSTARDSVAAHRKTTKTMTVCSGRARRAGSGSRARPARASRCRASRQGCTRTRVRSYRSIGGSTEYAYSSAISRTVPEPALRDIGLSGSSGDGRITLSWTRDPNADGYEIKQLEVLGCGRNTSPGRAVTKCDSWFTEAAIASSYTTSHVVKGLTSGETYNHRARSFRGSEYGPYSFDATEVVGVAPTSTPTPTPTPHATLHTGSAFAQNSPQRAKPCRVMGRHRRRHEL